MIRKEDLLEAIAECEGAKHPTSSTCLKLASYYTILKELDKDTTPAPTQYSFQKAPAQAVSDSEFASIVAEKGYERSMPILDEAMTALLVVNQRMYEGIIRQLRSL